MGEIYIDGGELIIKDCDVSKEASELIIKYRKDSEALEFIYKDFKRLTNFWHKDKYLDGIVKKWEGGLIINIAIDLIKYLRKELEQDYSIKTRRRNEN